MTTNNSINAPFPFATNIGGTGVSSVTVVPASLGWAGWDTNKNMNANRFVSAYTTTATAASTTTLSVTSTYQQFFTGSTTQTVLLPVVSTLQIGDAFLIVNNSTGVVTVQSSGGNTIQAMAANTTLLVTSILNSGTTASSWTSTYGASLSQTLPALTTSSLTFSPSTGGIVGTTAADNAAAGKVGEYISSNIDSSTPVAITNNTLANVTSIALTAGDWNVTGVIITAPAAGTLVTVINGSISATSATLAAFPGGGASNVSGWAASADQPTNVSMACRINISTPTTYFLVIQSTFSVSTCGAYGFIGARRAR